MNLPGNQLYWRIGDIARWLDLEQHVLRYWESEFSAALKPLERSKHGQRVYSRRHAILLATIKELLYVELYTIAGAKRQLRLAVERAKETA